MPRLKTAILVVMVLLMPLRGFAAATMPLWDGSQDPALEHQAGCHHEEGAPATGGEKSHGCADHGCCASFLAPAALDTASAVPGSIEIVPGQRFGAGFVPDHLDPPPVAL